jgi:predicted O-linked N-acetylglucosamine transferase (SPINDLY family)
LRQAVALEPDYAQAHYNLGVLLYDQGFLTEAEASYARALAIKPDYAEAESNLGSVFLNQNRLLDAESCFRRALALKPDLEDAFSNLLFLLNYDPDRSGEQIFAVYREYDQRFSQPLRSTWQAHDNSRVTTRRLKIGYVSPDFCSHPVRYFLEPLLERHDRQAFEIYAYAELSREDEVTTRYKSTVDHWMPTQGLSDEALAERIRADKIDILVDLAGHSAHNRLQVFARKPAPISVSWLGYGYTTGLTAIDYLLTDAASAPAGSEGLFSETPWRLTTPAYAFRPAAGMGLVGALPAHERGFITFGTLTRAIRINQWTIRVWSEILKRVDGSRLVVNSKNFQESALQEALAQRFAVHGIRREQLEIGYNSPPWDVLRGIDIGLDCFPHNSGTTLFETLYMGVPFVTLAGRPSVGRLGSSILEGLGHPEWIARSEEEYVEKAVALASDLPGLAKLRAELRQEMESGPLMDETGFARKVETAYREMFVHWVAGQQAVQPTEITANPSPPQPTPSQILDEAFDKAIAYYCGGQLDAAEQLYRAILQAEPKHPAANHHLGLLNVQLQQAEAALPYLLAALETNPEDADYWLAYIDALLLADQVDAAQQVLEFGKQHGLAGKVVEDLMLRLQETPTQATKETSPDALVEAELVSLFREGRYSEGVVLARNMTEHFPQHGFGWKILGALLSSQGHSADALQPLQKAAQLLPQDAPAQSNLGLVLAELNRLPEAEACLRRALAIKPLYADAYNNLGTTLKLQGRLAEAEASYRTAIDLRPEFAEVHNNLGILLRKQNRPAEAEKHLRIALEHRPDLPDVHYNLANALSELGRFDEAVVCFRQALTVKPKLAEAHRNLAVTFNNLAISLQNLCSFSEAESCYRQALAEDPDYEDTFGSLLFLLNYDPDRSGEQIFAVYREYDQRFSQPLRSTWQAHHNSQLTTRRLKIGYVSPDFCNHSVQYFLEPLLARHDRQVFDIYAYAELAREDEVTTRYENTVDHWIPTQGLSDEALAERIRADEIDILVDLAGHSARNRLQVFARKPAPVSVSWLGYGYTTGLTAIDYLLTDDASVPAGSEGLFSETPWRLTTPAYVYRPAAGMGPVGVLPAHERGFITFGTLTRAIRINHRTIRVWSEILKRVEGSRLAVNCGNFKEPAQQEALAQRFAAHGIRREQLEIGYNSPPWDVLRGFDIGLDCFPHNSGTTLFQTLYMGVPYVTLAGRPSVGRLGSSILEGLGHPEWIACSEEEYIAKAVALAADIPRLAKLRAGLRLEMEASPLMDEADFARRVEAAYREMFAHWATTQRCNDPQYLLNSPHTPDAVQVEPIEDPGLPSLGQSGVIGKINRPVKHPPKPASRKKAQPTPQEVNALAALFNEGRYNEGIAQARIITERFPQHGFGWKVLGALLSAQGHNADALEPMQKSAQLSPEDEQAQTNLGLLLGELGRLPEAETCHRQALVINPQFAPAHNNLGTALKQQGQLAEAEASYRTAIALKPDYAKAHYNLGITLSELGRFTEAEAAHHQAIKYSPDFAEAHLNLGVSLHHQGRLSEALPSFRRALALKANYAEAESDLGSLLLNQSCLLEAENCFRRALALKPDFEDAFSNLLFLLNYDPNKSGEEIFAAYREYDEHFCQPLRGAWRTHQNSRETTRRLKIGYVSPDFFSHSVRYFLEPLLARHDRHTLEIYAYAELAREDETTTRYKSMVDHWVPTLGLSDEALTARIRSDEIDVLVDLAGHTAHNRLQVFARKPAPVSVSWLGYGYTTGLTAIDYLLTDETSVPLGSEGLFSETPWRLATPAYVYRPAAGMGPVGALPARKRGSITFGTLTRAVRINHRTIRVWSEILKRVDDSRLAVNSRNFQEDAEQEALAKRFAAHGIRREQLEIGYRSPPWDVLRGFDIGLDCFPHNSGTTLFETLYMGIPYVTLAGRPSVGRLGSSILEGVGHPEWIARSEEEYIEKAVALAADLPRLADLRAGLRQEIEASPLMDEVGFARKVETAYREMFAHWATGQQSHAATNSHAAVREEPVEAPDLPPFGQSSAIGEVSGPLKAQTKSAEPTARQQAQPTQQEVDALAAFFNEGRYSEGVTLARSMTERFPLNGFGWKVLGALLSAQGHRDDALEPMQKSAQLSPNDEQAQTNLGLLLGELCRQPEAEACHRRALEINPQFAPAHHNLGVALKQQGRIAEAEASYRTAILLKPDYTKAQINLGITLYEQGRFTEAEVAYLQVLADKPDSAEAYLHLGISFHDQGRFSEAKTLFLQALAIKTNYAEAENNLACIFLNESSLLEAENCLRRALAQTPNFEAAFSNLLFLLNYDPDKSGEAIFADYRTYNERFCQPLQSAWRAYPNNREAARRLRIGYVSPDFRKHAVRHFLEPLLARHDQQALEIYAYAQLKHEDETTARYKGMVDHWVPTLGLSDEVLAERIRSDEIDILVDIAGHTASKRLQVFARKPAPVSVSWLGYGYTTGLTAIDYFLTDETSAPLGSEGLFSETPWRLATPAYVYRPASGMGPVGALPAHERGSITFGTLTRAIRINHRTIRVWSEILKRVEGSRLVVNSKNFREPAQQETLAQRFAAHGIGREQLEIGFNSPPWDVLRGIDIGLDCFPHNSGTTLFETLYMGIPYVTLAGRPSVGRLGSSILEGLGHPEWIAHSEEEYVEKAVALAADIPKLADLRAGLRQEMEASPLMDEVGFARKVETAYRAMWCQWCTQQKEEL